MIFQQYVALYLCLFINIVTAEDLYSVNANASGRAYEGIGALSGGGATSRLLVNYDYDRQSEILDFLFKPGFGASLNILKVEIGGDGQSSDGSESSHMHTRDEENYNRGYEWWLMKQARQRNSDIKLCGLSWSWPSWLSGGGLDHPYSNLTDTALYTVKWVEGAKRFHNLTIDCVGVWNEKPYDVKYIKTLRKTLNDAGFSNVEIVAADGKWDIADDMLKDPQLLDVIDIIGVHYPGTKSPASAQRTLKRLWSSEDYSTTNDDHGAACWARILNQNYVNGNFTSTIAWNLITSYYDHISWNNDGLMTANQPWSGHYIVSNPIWATAHTTQFTSPGWRYLKQGEGSYLLKYGGSLVSLVSPDRNELTVVIESMTHEHSQCVRPWLPPYNLQTQTVTLNISGIKIPNDVLYLWKTQLLFDGRESSVFNQAQPLKVIGNLVTLTVEPNQLLTITTSRNGHKGSYAKPPPPKPFPAPYIDSFDKVDVEQEPAFFMQQVGVFEVHADYTNSSNRVLRQVITQRPVHWCPLPLFAPMTIFGTFNWSDVSVSVDVRVPASSGSAAVFVALHLNGAGCNSFLARGVFLWLQPSRQKWFYTHSLSINLPEKAGKIALDFDRWYSVRLQIKEKKLWAAIGSNTVLSGETIPDSVPALGFNALGVNHFATCDFDNVLIQT